MAICLSHIMSAMAGSVGGITYFRNRFCQIVARARVTPVDPATAAQVVVRGRFGAAMAAWQALSQSLRDDWHSFAQGTPWNNSLGQDTTLTGLGVYMSIRLAALHIDPTIPSASFDSCQCLPGLFPRETVTLTPCTAGVLNIGILLSMINNHPTKSIRLGVHMSAPQNTSINFWKGPYDNRAYFATAVIPPTFGITQNIIGLINGSRYFFRFRILNATDNNIVSSPWYDQFDAAFCVS